MVRHNFAKLVCPIVFAIFVCRSAMGANVAWNGFGMMDMSAFTGKNTYLVGCDGADGRFCAEVILTLVGDGNHRTVTGSGGVDGFSGKWIVASLGAVIDAVCFGSVSDPLVATELAVSSGTPVQVDVPGTYYLAVQVETLTDADVGFADASRYTGEFLYGWVALALDEYGMPTIQASAIDLDGGPMVVGGGAYTDATPEPSAGLLFLIGLAVLGLRRRTHAATSI